ncbi:MAG: Mov34/MPN/PAD-1 family protein [Gemmataceae bacterium]
MAFRALFQGAARLLTDFQRAWLLPRRRADRPAPRDTVPPPPAPISYDTLKRLTLTDEVGRSLFEGYATHRESARGDDETGWILLGLREQDEAIALATLPAGADSDAGVAHVRFNSAAQAVASCMVRQSEKRLNFLGVVHTHPGSLRHPSEGDFRGDSQFVKSLRGREGVFGIGTADSKSATVFAEQPKPHRQCLGELCLSWYSLKEGDKKYRPLAYNITIGPDLARPLHSVWDVIEKHADALDRLYRQQKSIGFEVIKGQAGPALALSLPLAEPDTAVRVLLEGNGVKYFLARGQEWFEADTEEPRIDRGVYLLLADLATRE